MAQVINVILQVGSEEYNINKTGLLSMSFDRYLGNQNIKTTSVLSELDLIFFDKTGNVLLKLLQDRSNKIKLKYGFDDNLSAVFQLNTLKINTTYNNLGCTIAIGAIAQQQSTTFPAEVYIAGTNILSILKRLAKRNGWYIGEHSDITNYINISPSLVLPNNIIKLQTQTDIDFIINKIKPICEMSVINLTNTGTRNIELFDVRLLFRGINEQSLAAYSFYFTKNFVRETTRTLWTYEYGSTFNNQIVSMTNKIDQSYLVNGISLQIPQTLLDKSEALLLGEENNTTIIKSLVANRRAEIDAILERYNLPTLSSDDFVWKVEFIESENVGNKTVEELIIDRFEQVISVLNVVELDVIGNPHIQPGDLVHLKVMQRSGNNSYFNPYFQGYWKVVKISEEINMSGYTTKLSLVREIIHE